VRCRVSLPGPDSPLCGGVKRRGDGRCPGAAGLGSWRRPAVVASVVVVADSAAPFLVALWALGAAWGGAHPTHPSLAAKSSPDLSFPLIPQSHAMAATVAANGCQGLNYSLSMSLGITEPSR